MFLYTITKHLKVLYVVHFIVPLPNLRFPAIVSYRESSKIMCNLFKLR